MDQGEESGVLESLWLKQLISTEILRIIFQKIKLL